MIWYIKTNFKKLTNLACNLDQIDMYLFSSFKRISNRIKG